MNILSVIVCFGPGGAETLAVNLSREWAKSGHTVTVAALCHAESLGHSQNVERRLASEVVDSGGTPVVLGLKSRFALPVAMLRIAKMLREREVDVVHVHTPIALAYLCYPYKSCSVFYTHHNSSFGRIKTFIRIVDHFVSGYIAIGSNIAAAMAPIVKKPLTIIRNGVGGGNTASSVTVRRERIRFLAVGTLKKEKDYLNLIEAFSKVVSECGEDEKATLSIVGSGPDLSHVERCVHDLDLSERVFLLGARSDVHTVMAEHDVMVSSSSMEGFPMALLEAASHGLPIIATDVGEVRNIVRDGINGRLVPPQNSTALADAILGVIRSPESLLVMGKKSLEIVEEFSIEKAATSYIEFFESHRKQRSGFTK